MPGKKQDPRTDPNKPVRFQPNEKVHLGERERIAQVVIVGGIVSLLILIFLGMHYNHSGVVNTTSSVLTTLISTTVGAAVGFYFGGRLGSQRR